MKLNTTILKFFILCALIGCKNISTKKSTQYNYSFNKPKILELTNTLKEISGLSFYDNAIYTHNDEDGILFKINPKSGAIEEKVKFSKDADYEGIEVLNNQAIFVKNNGDILFYNLSSKKIVKEKTKLNAENNVEGLCAINSNELLLACKGKTLKGKSEKEKDIYSFNISSKKLKKQPFLTIKDNKIIKFLNGKTKKKLKNRAIEFSPSGIAIHPKTKDIYLISARGSTLIIFDQEKKMKDIIFLNDKQLPQPEGICFDNKANLYISTEVKKGAGKIYKYSCK